MFTFTPYDKEVFDRPFDTSLVGREEDQPIFESADPDGSSIDDFADRQLRAAAMATALTWIDDGEFTFDALNVLVTGMVDLDDDDEVGEDEEADYNDLLAMTGDALSRLGGSAKNVQAFLDDEDDEAGAKLGKRLKGKMDDVSLDDGEIITRYSMRSGEAVLEAAKRVIRDGKVVLKKKRVKKYRMNAAQRQALKKARRKSHSAAARRARAKSVRIRKTRGLK